MVPHTQPLQTKSDTNEASALRRKTWTAENRGIASLRRFNGALVGTVFAVKDSSQAHCCAIDLSTDRLYHAFR